MSLDLLHRSRHLRPGHPHRPAEAGAEFDLVKLNIAAGQQQSPDYLRVNQGPRAALATPQGVLTDPALLASWRRLSGGRTRAAG